MFKELLKCLLYNGMEIFVVRGASQDYQSSVCKENPMQKLNNLIAYLSL